MNIFFISFMLRVYSILSLVFFIGVGLFLFSDSAVYAAAHANLNNFGLGAGSDAGNIEITTVENLLSKVVKLLMGIVGSFSLMGILIGGVMTMMGGFSESNLDRGKDILLYSVIGLAVSLLAYAIATLVQTFFYSFS